MSKKLSAEESLKSLSAINDYRIDNPGNEKKNEKNTFHSSCFVV